jgi:hypothetical protein
MENDELRCGDGRLDFGCRSLLPEIQEIQEFVQVKQWQRIVSTFHTWRF